MKTSAKKGKKRKKKVSLGKKEEEKEAGNERSESSGQDVVAEHPVHKSALSYGLHSSVARALVAGGITTFFPVQELAVPPIICGSYGEWGLSPDVCVSAPTGSGKTLIYVCVTLQAVCRRVVPKLRALVIVHTRDLARQVGAEFQRFARHVEPVEGAPPIRVELAVGGSRSFAAERRAILGSARNHPADIVVATPGRLMDHIAGTGATREGSGIAAAKLSLSSLRLLVVDEADRLMSQAYQGWIRKVTAAAGILAPADAVWERFGSCDYSAGGSVGADGGVESTAAGFVDAGDGLAEGYGEDGGGASAAGIVGGGSVRYEPLRRLLFSATLQRDPEKLSALGVDPSALFIHAGRAALDGARRKMAAAAAAAADAPAAASSTRVTVEGTADGEEEEGVEEGDEETGRAAGGKGGEGEGEGEEEEEGEGSEKEKNGKDPSRTYAYTLPRSLSEHSIVCDAGAKPLALLQLLCEICEGFPSSSPFSRVIVFTKSVDSSHRLCGLLRLLCADNDEGADDDDDDEEDEDEDEEDEDEDEDEKARDGDDDKQQQQKRRRKKKGPVQTPFRASSILEYSGSVSLRDRERAIASFAATSKKSLPFMAVVCSDAMARGLDIANVTHVVNYDAPSFAETYVHRVGRTARAGRRGDCFTLLSRGQAKHFHSMLRCVDHNRVARHALDSNFVKQWERRYVAALGELKSQIKEEEERATDIVGRGGRRNSKGKDKRKRQETSTHPSKRSRK